MFVDNGFEFSDPFFLVLSNFQPKIIIIALHVISLFNEVSK